jgi:hypothetical protein
MTRRVRSCSRTVVALLGVLAAASTKPARGGVGGGEVLVAEPGADVAATATLTAAGAVEEQVCGADGTCSKVSPSDASPGEQSADEDETSTPPTTTPLMKILPPDKHPYCALYLAESTIPGAGMGIFTVEEKRKGETVSRGDLCIPFIDMYWWVSPAAATELLVLARARRFFFLSDAPLFSAGTTGIPSP